MNDEPNSIRNTPDAERVSIDEVRIAETRRTRQRNTIIIIAVVAIVFFALVVLVVWRWRRSKTEAEAEVTPVVSVRVAKAEKGSIAAPIVAVGTIWPHEKADVGAK